MQINARTYNDYLNRMKKVATSIFEWVNLPNSMNARWIELCLYYNGSAALLYDNKYGFINTKATSAGKINIYGIPTKINCNSFEYNSMRRTYSGLNGVAKKDQECILVMNNYDRTPTASTIELFALRLYEAERSCDVNIKSQKFPIALTTNESQRLTMSNLYNQVSGNEPVIIADKNLGSIDSIKVLKTEAPFIAHMLVDYKKQIWNEFLSFIGINNIDFEKKERLVAAEANGNNESINLNLMSYLVPRQEACRQFNEKFGLSGKDAISVRVRSDLHNVIKEQASMVADYDDKDEYTTDLGEGA